MIARVEKMRAALRMARRYIEAEKNLVIECHCVPKGRALRPDLSTIEPEALPIIRRLERVLKQIDEALK